MTTWPSSNKTSTTDIDHDVDVPNLSRAAIKNDVDNVNDIIDMFNITDPAQGDVLSYDANATNFTLVTGNIVRARLTFTGYDDDLADGATNADDRRNFEMDRAQTNDPFNITTELPGDGLELQPGQYIIESHCTYAVDGQGLKHLLIDVTSGYPIDSAIQNLLTQYNTDNFQFAQPHHYFTFTVSTGTTKKLAMFAYDDGNNYDYEQSTILVHVTKIG